MSKLPDHAVFTLRDLNRQPTKVLQAVRKFGAAEIRTRAGEVFTMTARPKAADSSKSKQFPDFRARWNKLRELGNTPPPSAENDRIDRIIAGEE